MQTVAERFLELIKHDTQSDYGSESYPSTPSQLGFGKRLAEMCREIGLTEVEHTGHGYVFATLPANTGGAQPVIGFLAHMDTSPDAPAAPMNARVVQNYDGGDIRLNEGVILSPGEFPDLLKYKGQDLIVTDGNTLLGADDKAGIAEILAAMDYLTRHPEIKHGKVRIAFTPDEEVGRGVDFFDTTHFGADFAYTVDGGELGELEWETFNAARAFFTVTGKSVHPGTAYLVMVNAALVGAEMVNAFPAEIPYTTRGREGFYHLTEFNAEVGKAEFSFLLRDFDAEGLERRKGFVRDLADVFNERYGHGTVALHIKDEYRNMGEVLANHPLVMERARQAMVREGISPVERPIRGGTDGARLSFMGLPCPNIFTGGHNGHGPYEFIPVQSMEAAVKVITRICAVG
jgi:tripeptide aminopeptidase